MHCPNCGQQTNSELKFCRSCGMKLDSVAKALNQHLDVDDTDTAIEKGRGRTFPTVSIGVVLMFIGIVIGVAGQGMWGAKTAAVILSLLGMLIMVYRFLPAAARYDRDLLRSVGQKEMRKVEPELELPAGNDFKPVPSVTEGTTRNLNENKTKVLR